MSCVRLSYRWFRLDHFQVADKAAGGVHLVQTFRTPVLLGSYRNTLHERLQSLDQRHPDLAARARAAGMKTLGELEVFPDPQKGFRLPLCAGRTMLLDRPLELVYDKRLKREVQDVIGYVSWLSRDDKQYMPAEEVFRFVKNRLRTPQPKPQADPEARKADKAKPKRVSGGAGGLGSLGKMQGRFAQVLVDFWSGRLSVPDTLNTGIRLLALPLPYYLDDQEEAIQLIEQYIDDLPDVSFSSRLSAGDRAEVSRIVANMVRQVYEGNGGQPDPEASSEKLKATVAAWKKRSFDPTDKSTWYKASAAQPCNLAPEFFWQAEEVIKVGRLQRLLNVSLQVASDAVKFFLRLVKGHTGEIAVSFVKNLLERFGVKCGHNGKANQFLDLLRQWDWIRMTAREKWYARESECKGRARTYAIGEAMVHKFERKPKAGLGCVPLVEEKKSRNLSFTSHRGFGNRATNLNFLTTRANNRHLAGVGDVEHNKGSPYYADQHHVLRPLERRTPRQALVQERPQAINVGRRACVAHLAGRLLRCHVRRRAHDGAGLADLACLGVDALGQAEVADLGHSLRPGQQHVARFQVAMHHPAQMGVVHRPRQRLDQLGRFARRRALLLELLGERAAVAELQREVRLAAHLADLVQRHDVRVLQAGHRFGFDLEAQPVGGAGVLDGADHLQRHQAIGAKLARPVDDAHAAVAADAQDLVARYLRVLPALGGRQVGGDRRGVARPLRRSVVRRIRRRQAIGGQGFVHRPPRSDRNKTIPPLYSHPSAVLASQNGPHSDSGQVRRPTNARSGSAGYVSAERRCLRVAAGGGSRRFLRSARPHPTRWLTHRRRQRRTEK
jgi:hypothetical protein